MGSTAPCSRSFVSISCLIPDRCGSARVCYTGCRTARTGRGLYADGAEAASRGHPCRIRFRNGACPGSALHGDRPAAEPGQPAAVLRRRRQWRRHRAANSSPATGSSVLPRIFPPDAAHRDGRRFVNRASRTSTATTAFQTRSGCRGMPIRPRPDALSALTGRLLAISPAGRFSTDDHEGSSPVRLPPASATAETAERKSRYAETGKRA